MNGQITIDGLTDKIEIRGTFSGWKTVTKEEAGRFANGWYKRITTNIDKEAYINERLRGTTYAELMKEMKP